MRLLTVSGLNADGTRLVLRAGTEVFELALADVPPGRQPALPFAGASPPTPRQIQLRLRRGESVRQIAEDSGLPVEAVDRYAGPVLAERELQASRARAARYDGRPVEELVLGHLTRQGVDPTEVHWDCWLTEQGPWEVRAVAPGHVVRLAWDAAGHKVQALDEASRPALRQGSWADDALADILAPAPAPPRAARSGPRPRLGVVPLWDEQAAETP